MRFRSALVLTILLASTGSARAGGPPTKIAIDFDEARRDPRASAVANHLIDDRAPGEPDAAITEVLRSLAASPSNDAADALFALFARTHRSWPKASHQDFAATLSDALFAHHQPRWEDRLIAIVETPVEHPLEDSDAATVDQRYWQQTAVRLLGKARTAKAVRALLKVRLARTKAVLYDDALFSLTSIGRPAVEVLAGVLEGREPTLAAFAEAEFRRQPSEGRTGVLSLDGKYRGLDDAAFVLAHLGRSDAAKPLLARLAKGDLTGLLLIAPKLAALPSDSAVTASFKRAWSSAPPVLDEVTPSMIAMSAKARLTTAVSDFVDVGLAETIARDALALGGDADEVYDVQRRALLALLRIGGPAQLPLMEQLVAKTSSPDGGSMYFTELAECRTLFAECGERVPCYLSKLESSSLATAYSFVQEKAVYMVAALGGEAVRGKLLALRPSAPTFSGATEALDVAILRLTPRGDADTLAALEALLHREEASGDPSRSDAAWRLRYAVHELRARAEAARSR